jgi:putative DNA primase/helicase
MRPTTNKTNKGGLTMNSLEKYNYLKLECCDLEKINHNVLAQQILQKENIITFKDTTEIYAYNQEKGIYEPCESELNTIVQHVGGIKVKTHFVNEVKESIKRQTYIGREEIAKDFYEIPLENGIYNFKTKEFYEYGPEKIFLTKHPIIWTDQEFIGTNPIDLFLEQITENQEDMLLLKEIVGYCYYRKMPFQNFFILVGKGSNGKSVYLNILREMIGNDNSSNRFLQDLAEGGFNLISLYNKNANISNELPKKALTDAGVIKQLTGGDMIEANQKFRNSIKFISFAKLISACNEVPETPDMSDGFFRRAMLINFPNNFEGRENRNLLEELITPENLFDFFKSCIDAFSIALENNSFIRSESSDIKREKYLVYSNSAISFCYHHLEYDPEAFIETDEIYQKYSEFCKNKRVPTKDERIFFKSLYQFFGHKVYKKRKRENEFDKSIRVYIIQGVDWK